MARVKQHLASLALGLAVAAAATPSFAQRSEDQNQMSGSRAQAIRECSVLAQRYPQSTWGDTQGDQYRACMAQHGQRE
jgi:hypothetical protein